MEHRSIHTWLPVFILTVTLTLLQGCASVPPETFVGGQGDMVLKDLCKKNDVFWQWDAVSQVIILKKNQFIARALAGSDVVLLDGQKIFLSRPIVTVKSSIIVPPDFEWKVIKRFEENVVERIDYSLKPLRTVIVDAGHGGKDPGAIGVTGLKEKEVVLDIARRLKRILENKGLKVVMTRDSDTFISLEERTKIASSAKADFFVSVHANSSPAQSVSGVEVYSLKPLDSMDRQEAQRLENEGILFNKLSMAKGDHVTDEIVSDLLYSYKEANSARVAAHVAESTAMEIRGKNRGSKESRFFVLRNTLIPAVLVECGFLTNLKEERALNKGIYREKVARGIALSVLEYANIH